MFPLRIVLYPSFISVSNLLTLRTSDKLKMTWNDFYRKFKEKKITLRPFFLYEGIHLFQGYNLSKNFQGQNVCNKLKVLPDKTTWIRFKHLFGALAIGFWSLQIVPKTSCRFKGKQLQNFQGKSRRKVSPSNCFLMVFAYITILFWRSAQAVSRLIKSSKSCRWKHSE